MIQIGLYLHCGLIGGINFITQAFFNASQMFSPPLHENILDAAIRLLKLLKNPKDGSNQLLAARTRRVASRWQPMCFRSLLFQINHNFHILAVRFFDGMIGFQILLEFESVGDQIIEVHLPRGNQIDRLFEFTFLIHQCSH